MADATHEVSPKKFVEITITNSQNDFSVLRRFFTSTTVADFKARVELLAGGRASCMRLELFNKDDYLVGVLDRDNATIDNYPIESGCRVHMTDTYKCEEDSVPKFELTQEQYDARPHTLKSYLRDNKLGKYDEASIRLRKEQKAKERRDEAARADKICVGQRCQVSIPGMRPRRGSIAFKGHVKGQHGIFIGVRYDDPVGKNDGSLGGCRYFPCDDMFGGFLKPRFVAVGDFPPEDEISDFEEI